MRTRDLTRMVQAWKAERLGAPVSVEDVAERFPEILDPLELCDVYAKIVWKHPVHGWVH